MCRELQPSHWWFESGAEPGRTLQIISQAKLVEHVVVAREPHAVGSQRHSGACTKQVPHPCNTAAEPEIRKWIVDTCRTGFRKYRDVAVGKPNGVCAGNLAAEKSDVTEIGDSRFSEGAQCVLHLIARFQEMQLDARLQLPGSFLDPNDQRLTAPLRAVGTEENPDEASGTTVVFSMRCLHHCDIVVLGNVGGGKGRAANRSSEFAGQGRQKTRIISIYEGIAIGCAHRNRCAKTHVCIGACNGADAVVLKGRLDVGEIQTGSNSRSDHSAGEVLFRGPQRLAG